MVRQLQRQLRDRRGQSMVELALVLPVLLILILGMIDFGRLIQAYLTVQHAAREGSRLAITGAADSAVVQRVRDMAQGLNQSQLAVTVSPAGTRYSGSDVTVTVQFDFRVMTPILRQIAGGGQFPVDVSITSRVE